MPHADPTTAGPTGGTASPGMKDASQSEPGARSLERAPDDPHQAPESGEKPEVMSEATPQAMPGQAATHNETDLSAIYQALKHNAGRERVTDDNVAALITMAEDNGDTQLEYLLREWRSSCGDDADAPPVEQVQGLPPP